MTTAELMDALKKLDPKGTRDVWLRIAGGPFVPINEVVLLIVADDPSEDPFVVLQGEEQ